MNIYFLLYCTCILVVLQDAKYKQEFLHSVSVLPDHPDARPAARRLSQQVAVLRAPRVELAPRHQPPLAPRRRARTLGATPCGRRQRAAPAVGGAVGGAGGGAGGGASLAARRGLGLGLELELGLGLGLGLGMG